MNALKNKKSCTRHLTNILFKDLTVVYGWLLQGLVPALWPVYGPENKITVTASTFRLQQVWISNKLLINPFKSVILVECHSTSRRYIFVSNLIAKTESILKQWPLAMCRFEETNSHYNRRTKIISPDHKHIVNGVFLRSNSDLAERILMVWLSGTGKNEADTKGD